MVTVYFHLSRFSFLFKKGRKVGGTDETGNETNGKGKYGLHWKEKKERKGNLYLGKKRIDKNLS